MHIILLLIYSTAGQFYSAHPTMKNMIDKEKIHICIQLKFIEKKKLQSQESNENTACFFFHSCWIDEAHCPFYGTFVLVSLLDFASSLLLVLQIFSLLSLSSTTDSDSFVGSFSFTETFFSFSRYSFRSRSFSLSRDLQFETIQDAFIFNVIYCNG